MPSGVMAYLYPPSAGRRSSIASAFTRLDARMTRASDSDSAAVLNTHGSSASTTSASVRMPAGAGRMLNFLPSAGGRERTYRAPPANGTRMRSSNRRASSTVATRKLKRARSDSRPSTAERHSGAHCSRPEKGPTGRRDRPHLALLISPSTTSRAFRMSPAMGARVPSRMARSVSLQSRFLAPPYRAFHDVSSSPASTSVFRATAAASSAAVANPRACGSPAIASATAAVAAVMPASAAANRCRAFWMRARRAAAKEPTSLASSSAWKSVTAAAAASTAACRFAAAARAAFSNRRAARNGIAAAFTSASAASTWLSIAATSPILAFRRALRVCGRVCVCAWVL